MRGILKITALLMGSLLCIFTLVAGRVRPDDPLERVPLLSQDDYTYDPVRQRLVQIWPGVPRPLILTDSVRYLDLYGVDVAGTSLYYQERKEDLYHLYYYRIGPTSLKPQLLVEAKDNFVVPSPNFTWVLYNGQTPSGAWEYRARNIQTGQEWSITQRLQSRPLSPWVQHRFSADEQWLYIVGDIPNPPDPAIVAVHLSDGTSVELTSGLAHEIDGRGAFTFLYDWVFFGMDKRLYRIRNDGTGLHPLFDENQVVGPVEAQDIVLDYVAVTYPHLGVVVVQYRTLTLGIAVETGRLLWQYLGESRSFSQNYPSEWAISFGCQRLNVVTGVIQTLNGFDSWNLPEYLATDTTGRWMAYSEVNRITQHNDFWLYDWDTGQSRLIRRAMDGFQVWAWSPDGEWLLMEDEIHNNLYQLRVSDGSLEQLTTGGKFYPRGWMHPFTRTWQPIPLLLIAIALLIIGLIPRRLLKMGRRTW